jgi:hypothetical protein
MTATNKRLLISESRGDLNRCTPYRGKPDQHVTRFPHSVRVWSMTIRISRGPHITTFHTVVNRFEQIHCTREEWLLTQSTARWPSDPRVRTQLLSHNSQWSSGEKSSFYWQPTNRLIGPISPACDRYVQYLLTGPTERSLIDIGGGYNIGGAGLPRTHSPTFPSSYPHFPLVVSPGLQFNQVLTTKSKFWV